MYCQPYWQAVDRRTDDGSQMICKYSESDVEIFSSLIVYFLLHNYQCIWSAWRLVLKLYTQGLISWIQQGFQSIEMTYVLHKHTSFLDGKGCHFLSLCCFNVRVGSHHVRSETATQSEADLRSI